MPTLAISTPSLNHERYVTAFIESVVAQNCPGVRLCVVDDASVDGNYTLLSELQARHGFTLLRNERRMGIVPTLRRAFTANGEADFYFVIASDDLLEPNFARSVFAYFEAHREVDAIVGNVVIIDSEGRQTGRVNAVAEGRIDLVRWAKGEQTLMPNWMVCRRRVMEAERPYEGDHALDDLPVFINIASKYEVRAAGFDFLRYRKHAQSYSSSRALEVYRAEEQVLTSFHAEPFYPYYMRQARINWFLNFSAGNKREAWRILPRLWTDLWRWRVLKGFARLLFYYSKK
jgi:glycosyltransferase involved in cell wall biosynthesis